MVSVGYTPPGGTRIELMDLDANRRGLRVRGLAGTGVPAMKHQTVATPNRDGATWLRVVADQRFVLVDMQINGSSWADLWSRQLVLIAALNPKQGLGVLDVTPDASTDTYTTDAILNDGLGFDTPPIGVLARRITLSFQCPDPAWRAQAPNQVAIVAGGVGLSVPLSVPLSIDDSGTTATVNNAGHLESYPLITITTTGGCTSPKVTNVSSGKSVWFSGLVMAAGQVLLVDNDRRTATLDGVNVMPYRSADSEAWALLRGENTIAVSVSTGDAQAELLYSTRLLGI